MFAGRKKNRAIKSIEKVIFIIYIISSIIPGKIPLDPNKIPIIRSEKIIRIKPTMAEVMVSLQA